jgi:hypothetical protein
MKHSKLFRSLLFFGVVCAVITCAHARQAKHREFTRTHEKAVRIVLDISFGSLTIQRGESGKIAEVDYDEEESNTQKFHISYDVSKESGTLHITLKESTHFWGDDEDSKGHHNNLDIKLSDALPISFEIELGAGKGEINLTDLQVREFNISTGASSVNIECEKPNSIAADDITIESGVSKLTAMDLGNLNFHNLKFSGGVGSYKLDFNGTLRQNTDVSIEVGLGSINVYIPKSTPAKLVYDDNWLSSFSIDDDFEKIHKGVYETDDFKSSSRCLTIRMEAGLGSVKVYRK